MCAYTTQVYVGSCPVCTPTSLRDQCMSSSQCMDGPSSAAAMLLFTAARLHVGLLPLVIADCFLWFYCWSAPRPASQVLSWTVCCGGCAAKHNICDLHLQLALCIPSLSKLQPPQQHSSDPCLSAALSLQLAKAAEWCKAPQPILTRAAAMHASWPSVSLNKQLLVACRLFVIDPLSECSQQELNGSGATRVVLHIVCLRVSLSSCPVQSACFLAGAHFIFLQMMELCVPECVWREGAPRVVCPSASC